MNLIEAAWIHVILLVIYLIALFRFLAKQSRPAPASSASKKARNLIGALLFSVVVIWILVSNILSFVINIRNRS
jgi:hypothetical protein